MKIRSKLAEKLVPRVDERVDATIDLPKPCRSCGHPTKEHTSEGCQRAGCECGHQAKAVARPGQPSDYKWESGG